MVDAGGLVIEVLETKSLGPTQKSDLTAWIDAYRIPVTTLIDSPPGVGTATYSAYGVRESLFIVDLRTMKIVQKFNGSVAGIGTSAVGQAVPAILKLLGG